MPLLPLWAFVVCSTVNFTFTQLGSDIIGQWQLLISGDLSAWRSHLWGHRTLPLPLLLATLSVAVQRRQMTEHSLGSRLLVLDPCVNLVSLLWVCRAAPEGG